MENRMSLRPLDFDDALIDPALRALSASASATAAETPQTEEDPLISRLPSASAPDFNPITPPFAEVQLLELSANQERVQERAQHEVQYLANESVIYPNMDPLLTPKSRRRLTKRMYMRRKRAEATGRVVEQTLSRLKPGRKSKPLPPTPFETAALGETGENNPATGEPSLDGAPDQEEHSFRHAHPSGLTLPYKMRARLDALGINAAWLREEGLDFFHMTSIGRLMRTYRAMHNVSPEVNSQISASTIRLLLAHVVHFVSEVVRRAIISREQEMIAKTQTKVWRLAENQVVTASNVAHALSLCGADHLNKKAHFQGLLDELDEDESGHDTDSDEEAEVADAEINSARHDSTDEENEIDQLHEDYNEPPSDILAPLPLHRLIFPPFIPLPYSLQSSSSSSVLSYLPWATGLSLDIPDDEDDLEPVEIDEDGLNAEFQEEEELDSLDRTSGQNHEKRLWEEFERHTNESIASSSKGKRKRTDDDDDEHERRRGERYTNNSMRFREPGGRIKSSVYIEDSD
ncbi:hypothetical protein EW026_g6283 [Hermanssonia centrifuga]|uniref:Homeodomain protein n=1 Tax=Hermanssonia centrifuga TaxID=98765 RepID=A0A4S4KBG6_9APHY|nr:hypothetical protein EW026_g6283 [Hermanssonia centrifuga]